MIRGVGHRNALLVGLEHVVFECASYMYGSQRLDFLDYLKKVLPPDAFKAFLWGSIFDKSAFCLGEKQDLSINDECSSWYNGVGGF